MVCPLFHYTLLGFPAQLPYGPGPVLLLFVIKTLLLGNIEDMNKIYKDRSIEWIVFCRRFLQNPSCIGSVIPSSRYLARKVAGSVVWEGCKTVVELGAGTGSFTKYLMAFKPPGTRVVLFEKDPVFRAKLKEKYRTIPLYDDAARLAEILAAEGIGKVDCIVSGLPFAMFSAAQRRNILAQIQWALPKDGQFITFQYSPQIYRELSLYFTKVSLGFTMLNVPPAIVYTCRR